MTVFLPSSTETSSVDAWPNSNACRQSALTTVKGNAVNAASAVIVVIVVIADTTARTEQPAQQARPAQSDRQVER